MHTDYLLGETSNMVAVVLYRWQTTTNQRFCFALSQKCQTSGMLGVFLPNEALKLPDSFLSV